MIDSITLICASLSSVTLLVTACETAPFNPSLSNELSNDEQIYFNFVDSNNDDKISLSEIEQSISIIFQIVDFNQDGFISNSEIRELKKIINSIK